MMRKLKALTVSLMLLFLFSPVLSQAETVYQLDFAAQENGKAFDWFKQESFKLQNDADEIKARFESGRLVLEVNKDITGNTLVPIPIPDGWSRIWNSCGFACVKQAKR